MEFGVGPIRPGVNTINTVLPPLGAAVISGTNDATVTTDPDTGAVTIDTRVIETVGVVTQEPTGFPDRTQSTVSVVDGTRTFTIAPTGVSYDVYVRGIKYTKAAPESVVFSDVEGPHYFYFNTGGVLSTTTSFSSDIHFHQGIVNYIYWDQTHQKHSRFAEERHDDKWPGNIHAAWHETFGATYVSGLTPANFTIGDGSSNTHAQFSIGNGVIRDEDIRFMISDGSPQDLSPILYAPIFYKEGASGFWRRMDPTPYPTATAGSGRAAYNLNSAGTWSIAECPEGSFIGCAIIATTDLEHPIIAIMDDEYHATLADIDAYAKIWNITSSLGALPFPEYIHVATVIFQTSSTYTNAAKSRIVQNLAGTDFYDFRKNYDQAQAGGTPSDHNSMLNLDAGAPGYYGHLTAAGKDALAGTSGTPSAANKFVTDADARLVNKMTVKDEGTNVASTPHTALNFVGAGVTVTDGGAGIANISISVGQMNLQLAGTNITNTPHATLNVSTGLSVVDAGGGVATITNSLGVFGQNYQSASATSETGISTVATGTKPNYTGGFTTKVTLTTTSLPAGTFMLSWSFRSALSDDDQDGISRLQMDGTNVAIPADKSYSDANKFEYTSFSLPITVTAGVKVLTLQFAVSATSTITVSDAHIMLWRVA